MVWTSQHEEFLAEVLRLEAPPLGSIDKCLTCHMDPGQYRCISCFDGGMYCAKCLREHHVVLPFHKVEVGLRFHYAEL